MEDLAQDRLHVAHELVDAPPQTALEGQAKRLRIPVRPGRVVAVERAQCTNLSWRRSAAAHSPSDHSVRGGKLDCSRSQEPRSSFFLSFFLFFLRGVAYSFSLHPIPIAYVI